MDPQSQFPGVPPVGNQTYPNQQQNFSQAPVMQQPYGAVPLQQGSFTQRHTGELTYAQPVQATPAQHQSPMPYTGEGVMLSSLPHLLRDVLDKYDTNRDGILDQNEMMHARQDMAKMRQIVESGRVPMSSFPETARQMLEEHDKNNDGELDVVEIIHGFEALQREKRRKHQLMWFSTGLILFSILLLVAVGGLMAYVIRLTKDTEVEGSVMYVKGTTDPIQTSASEFTVKDGKVVSRASGDCGDDQTCESPLKVSQAVQQGLLSSRLPDQDLQELKQMRIANGESWIQFEVLAVARYAETNSRYGSVVVIYTHIGELTLDGDLISFHEALEGSFSRAGFDVVGTRGSRRRLLGVVETIGMFNFLSTVLDPEDPTGGSGVPGEIPRVGPFVANMLNIVKCEVPGMQNCHLDDGSLVDWVTEDDGVKVLVWQERQEYYNVDGRQLAKTERSCEMYPGVTQVELFNGTDRFEYVLYADQRFHCKLEGDSTLVQAINGSGAGESTADVNADPDDYAVTDQGLVEVNGTLCQKYLIAGNGQAVAYYTVPDEAHRLMQLCFGEAEHMCWRYQALTFLADGAAPPDMALYDDFTEDLCSDSPFIEPPPPYQLRVDNAYTNNGAWGQPTGLPEEAALPSADAQQAIRVPLTPAQLEQFQASLTATQCVVSSVEVPLGEGGGSGGTLNHTVFDDCDASRRSGGSGTRQWTYDFGAAVRRSSECLHTSGLVVVIRTSNTHVYTAGYLTVTANPLVCFSGQLTQDQIDALEMETGSQTFTQTFDVTSFDPASNPFAGILSWYELLGGCAPGGAGQLGMLRDAYTYNISHDHMFSNIGAAQDGLIYNLAGYMRFDLVLLAQEKCGICQPFETDFSDETELVAFRLSADWWGTINWNMCQTTASLGSTNPQYAPCGSAAASSNHAGWNPTTFNPVKKNIFPGTSSSAGNCQTSDGVYRYQCRCPGPTHWDWPLCYWCQGGPLGVFKVPGTTCSRAPTWNPPARHVTCWPH